MLMVENPKYRSYMVLLLILWSQPGDGFAQTMSRLPDSVSPSERLNYHTAPAWTNRLMKAQHLYTIPSPLICDDGTTVSTPENWYQTRRPQLLLHWTRILGKLAPSQADTNRCGTASTGAAHHLACPTQKLALDQFQWLM